MRKKDLNSKITPETDVTFSHIEELEQQMVFLSTFTVLRFSNRITNA